MNFPILSSLILLPVIGALFLFFTKDTEQYKNTSFYISYFVIMLFSVFVSYDTSKMFEMAKICVNYPNHEK